MSSANNSSKDNGVEKNPIMTTHEISKTEKIDIDEPPSFVDDVINDCKDVLNTIVLDIYSKCGELKREQQFLAGIARRSFKKKNTFFCDICSIFLTSEKYCIQHLNGPEHLEKFRHYQTTFLPWRRAAQESLISGKSMKEVMGDTAYENYKKTMGLYLAPNSLSSRGRFCCAYCEIILTDQWTLEKHLHGAEHKEKETSADHKEIVVRYSNVVIIPSVYKFNGVTQLSEIPEDIKNRYQWRYITREQLEEDTTAFIQNYPFDEFEGATRIVNVRQTRKPKPSVTKSATQNLRNNNKKNTKIRNQPKRRGAFNNSRPGQFQTQTSNRGLGVKRTFPASASPPKRFRGDMNNSFPAANRGPGPIRNYEFEHYNYNRPAPYNLGNDRWPDRHSVNQQREEFFERSNYELHALASDNNGYYNSRPTQAMPRGNNYDHEQHSRFNSGGSGGNGRYDNQQANYDPNFIRAVAKAVAEYHPEPMNQPPFAGGPHRSHQRPNQGPSNEFIHQVANSIQRAQHQPQLPPQPQPAPIMGQAPYSNSNTMGGFGGNPSKNSNVPYFAGNQQQTPMGNNGPPIRSYAEYRSSTGPSLMNPPSTVYPPLGNTQNPVAPQSNTFDNYGRSSLASNSSNNYGRSMGAPFGNDEPHYNTFGRQNQMEQPSKAPWRGSSRGGNNARGRGQATTSQYHSTNKQPGATFSYSSSSVNTNNSSMRGRGANRNARNFGSRR